MLLVALQKYFDKSEYFVDVMSQHPVERPNIFILFDRNKLCVLFGNMHGN